ncbi:hypothetical protein A3J90_08215 [candidate division WOR-1 bacterium RIFOXYC2_FULL_37_10]|uniref:Hemolysin n=1 Tax=candidate division WOR-1 bacterium RIFOXYB2_FULL_37_13 TaxID=1802579 RepID=A0A1F4SQH5_UNCSA|nr:MAG: hypothetical protein A2246_00050 [candidate division WOR-1 bacterium RIFOXYA2_FULL_37_7]OGC22661.1 MAG: hypothetical protein A2310_07880 [candidate division WOR-1 bacterium RIFOXYB2_FULL_37_13]OGC37380.1 MAG: hypothetical protein A3J90_08215 [candidate division WOR-1 bacterium RIFOXYC2_FULL_37_10]
MIAEFIILSICFLFSTFFSIVETAYTSLSHLKVSHLVEKGVYGAALVKKLKDEPSKLLSVVLIGNNIANIGASVLATSIIISFFERRGVQNLGAVLGLATGIITFLILVFGEIIPKNIAIRNSDKIALIFSLPLFIVSIILTPISFVLTVISKPFVSLFGGKISSKGPFLTEDDLRFLIATSEKEGIIEKKERDMISSIFDFGDTTVKEVMTPRPDIKAIDGSVDIKEAVQIVKDTGHSRLPVYEANLDNIIGVIYAKDLLSCSLSKTIRDYMRSVIFIPEVKKIDELLRQMQKNRTHIAVVIDEYGVTSGIVSMEDIIEEIVGEIHDEFEQAEKNFEKIDQNTYLVSGKMPIYETNAELAIDIPVSDGYDTIAGFVVSMLGKMPSVGDFVKHENIEISVERVSKRRITRLKIVKGPIRIEDNIVGG